MLVRSSPLPHKPFADALQLLAPQIAVWTSIEEAHRPNCGGQRKIIATILESAVIWLA